MHIHMHIYCLYLSPKLFLMKEQNSVLKIHVEIFLLATFLKGLFMTVKCVTKSMLTVPIYDNLIHLLYIYNTFIQLNRQYKCFKIVALYFENCLYLVIFLLDNDFWWVLPSQSLSLSLWGSLVNWFKDCIMIVWHILQAKVQKPFLLAITSMIMSGTQCVWFVEEKV